MNGIGGGEIPGALLDTGEEIACRQPVAVCSNGRSRRPVRTEAAMIVPALALPVITSNPPGFNARSAASSPPTSAPNSSFTAIRIA